MKLLKVFFIAAVLLLSANSFAKDTGNPAEVNAVKDVITNYVKSTDNRNVDDLQRVLYPEGTFINCNKLTNKTSTMTNNEFIDMVGNGKAGGWERDLDISSVEVSENIAVAKVEISDARLKQSGYLTLIKDDNSWKIMSSAYTLESVK